MVMAANGCGCVVALFMIALPILATLGLIITGVVA